MQTPEIISRADALARGLTHFYTGKPCKHGTMSLRHVTGSRCICESCRAARSARVTKLRASDPGYAASQLASSKRHYQKNSERILAACKEYHQKNKSKRNESCRQYYDKNKDVFRKSRAEYYRANKPALIEYGRQWAKKNPEKHRESVKKWTDNNRDRVRENGRKWERANPIKMRAKWARRRAAEKQATPKWMTADHRAEIELIYSAAAELEKQTGVQHHVDHIVPLINPDVCGLHVPWNLQAIPANDNLKKSNKFTAA